MICKWYNDVNSEPTCDYELPDLPAWLEDNFPYGCNIVNAGMCGRGDCMCYEPKEVGEGCDD